MPDSINLTDYLILFLSSDWGIPYWPEIGANADPVQKIALQKGCRVLVVAMLDGAESYYHINFSPERRRKTEEDLRHLIKECNAEDQVLRVLEEWANLTHEKLNALTWYAHPTVMVVVDKQMHEMPRLDAHIREVLAEKWKTHGIEARVFPELAEGSESEWDAYLRSIFDPPDALGNLLWIVSLARRFERFWRDLCSELTASEIGELKLWYKAMMSNMLQDERPDLIPPYIAEPESAAQN